MAKKTKHKKLSIKDILKGKFLVEDTNFPFWKLMLVLMGLALIMITSAHLTDTKVVKIEKQKERLDEIKAKYALMQSKLIQMQLESELAIQVEQDSLISLEEHPIKIVVN